MQHFLISPLAAAAALGPCLLCLGVGLAQAQAPQPDPESVDLQAPAASPARSWLPAQDLSDGQVVDKVRGGRYGAVRIEADDPALQAAAQRWLRDFRPGEPIREGPLQRQLLLLKDLSGVRSKAVLGAGEAGAERDLTVTLQRGPRYSGRLGVDNHGSRFTGEERVRFDLALDSLWTLGDSLALQGERRWHGTWVANLGYTAPLGTSGLSGHVEVEHSYYQLHRERRRLGLQGDSNLLLLELAYPLWLDKQQSLRASIGWELTHSDDEARPRSRPPSAEHRKLQMVPLTLTGERENHQGKTSARLLLGLGRLRLDQALRKEDRTSAHSQGRYRLFNADLRHEHPLGKDWKLYGRFFGQKSSRNLDSEKWFVMAGPQKIRAWTSGEGQGDEGWLIQGELRRRFGSAEPFVFVDAGRVKLRRRPWQRAENWRSLSGVGLGLRWSQKKTWSVQAVAAWRTGSHRPISRLGYRNPRVWLSATYRF